MSLRSILGGGRVKKRSTARASPAPTPSFHAQRSSSKSQSQSNSPGKPRGKTGPSTASADDGTEEDFLGQEDKLDDLGVVHLLATDPSLRDVVQVMRHVREHMFSPLPESAGALGGSRRVAEVLNFRSAGRLPPVVTAAHVQTAMGSPTAAERETAELVRAGVVRKIVVGRRAPAVGEMLVLAVDLEDIVRGSEALGPEAREAFLRFLRENPGALGVTSGLLERGHVDQLVRAGFLTMNNTGEVVTSTGAFTRPEDRGTLTSLDTVSRAASGSIEAVGGRGAVHAVGGGGAPGSRSGSSPDYSLAVPGNGTFLKLVSGALARLTELLSKTRFREAPEFLLRARWDGVSATDAGPRRARGEFVGVPPGRTRKWREFYGLSFDWVLREAIGAGLVVVFETGSVGRGVRLV